MKTPRLVSVIFLLASSAAAEPKFLAKDFTPPSKVAVLPLSNASTDDNATIQVRLLLQDAVKDKGYAIVPEETVDEVLKSKFKIEYPDSPKEDDAAKLGSALEADAVLFGSVLGAKSQHLVVYNNEEVELDFKLFDAKTGKLLWEERKKAWNRSVADLDVKSGAKKAIAKGAAAKAVGVAKNLTVGKDEPPPDSPAAKAVRWAVASLPAGSGPRGKNADGATTKSTSSHKSESTTTEDETVQEY